MYFMQICTVKLLIKCLCILFLSVPAAYAANYDSDVFEFQQKLANAGNAHAQYRLATMYESGRGVDKDTTLAMKWYKKSSLNNHSAAKRQLVYIDIKNTGFKPHHKTWLTNVYSDGKNGDENALMILGKIHENGTGVNKDLKKSQRYFKLAFNKGNADAESNIYRVEEKILTEKNKIKNEKEIAAVNNSPKSKQPNKIITKTITKKTRNRQRTVKARAKPAKPNLEISKNKLELKRLQAERRKIAAERKKLELLRKEMADNKANEAKVTVDKPIKSNTFVSNETYKETDACSGKAARFMSICQ